MIALMKFIAVFMAVSLAACSLSEWDLDEENEPSLEQPITDDAGKNDGNEPSVEQPITDDVGQNDGNEPSVEQPITDDVGQNDDNEPSLEHLFHPLLASDVNLAIATGDYQKSTIPNLTAALNTLHENSLQEAQTIKNAVFGNGLSVASAITWDPTHDSAILGHTVGVNHPVFIANDSPTGESTPVSLGIAGYKHGTPYLAMGSNPFRTKNANASTVNEAMMQSMKNAVLWLSKKNAPIEHVVLVNMDDSYWFRDYPTTKKWLTDSFGTELSINDYQQCDDAKLTDCINATHKPDLIIVSQKMTADTDPAALAAQIDQALKSNIPVLYLNWYREANVLGTAVLSQLQIQPRSTNYWLKRKISNASVTDILQYQDHSATSLLSLAQKLQDDQWSFDLSTCDKNCANQAEFKAEFEDAAKTIQQRLRYFDRNNLAIFSEPSNEFDKLLVLLADAYRAETSYPFDVKIATSANYLRAYYADYAQFFTRNNNNHPKAMGNFSRTDFALVTPFTTELDITSRIPFRAAGLYALPAQTITITRLDNSDTDVSVFINTIRDGATHEWDDKGYLRPKFLRSPSIPLKPNTPVTLTPSYGGTLQLAFSKNHLPINIRFEGVAQHPVWRNEQDNVSFQAGLTAHQFDWAEILTPAFEVHSRHDLMMKTINNHPQWPTGGAIATATETFMHNFPHVLAGFKGAGIAVIPEIHDFADTHNLPIAELDLVKHMNADQGLCGYGCSGNPYDAYWSFSPIGHGDLHELGHGLERHRFRMFDATGTQMDGHAITNPYSYYSKTQYHKATGGAHDCQPLPFKELFDDLTRDSEGTLRDTWNNEMSLSAWNRGVATYVQFMMAAEAQSALEDGWHLWARLHIIEREFNSAVSSDTKWQSSQTNLGFNNIDLSDAKKLNNNDWMLIALSHATKLDYRPLFAMYGFATGELATDRVAAMTLPPTHAVFYQADGNNYCLGLNKPALNLDSTW